MNRPNNTDGKRGKEMPLTLLNYILMLIGFTIIIIGFILMAGGTEATPEVFSEDIYSWRRITLAPIVVVVGFLFEIFAIMIRFKPKR